jgi:tRNA threonylcarbamoyl adenosine modification protein (Sua5/YciO/YrdC/YwlC family)
MILEVHRQHPEPRKIQRAVDVLKDDGIVVYPTDTVYGMGCDITSKRAVERIYQLKGMKTDQPLAMICPDLGEIARYGMVTDRAYRLMRRLTPGPYCFILSATREAPRILQMKRKTVGIRIPHDEVALALVRALGHPIVSTTASRNGDAHGDPHEIADLFPSVELVLDGGAGGLAPTTVLDLTGDEIVVVRAGAGPVDSL